MNRKLFAVGILVAGVALSGVIYVSKPKTEPKPSAAPPAPQVNIQFAKPSSERLTVVSQGNVQPRREIDIVSQVSGIIVATHPSFANGGELQAGEVILQIEDADYRNAVTKVEAQVAEAEELLATERARANQAKKEWRDLGDKDANDLFLRKPQLVSAKARAAAAHADLEQAKLNLKRTRVVAPFNSRIREKYVDLGQYLTAASRIARIFATDRLEVRLPLTDKQQALIDLESADKPRVHLSTVMAGVKHQWHGQLVRTEASLDMDSRVLYAIVEVDNPFSDKQQALQIGAFVEAVIEGKQVDNVVTLPREALQVDQHILVLDSDNRIRFRDANVLQANRDTVMLQGDIRRDDRVIVSNLPLAVENMLVQPVEAVAEAKASIPN